MTIVDTPTLLNEATPVSPEDGRGVFIDFLRGFFNRDMLVVPANMFAGVFFFQ
jgi:hypothetical protein